MPAMNHLRFVLFVAAPFLIALLAACAAPANNEAAVSAPIADAAKPMTPGQKQMTTGGRLPPERVDGRNPDPSADPIAIDATCKTDADCTVKNVGNCCGYYPACVNVNSPTDPKGVQAECAKKGMASVCGFPEISSCNCTQGRCEAAPGGAQVR